MDDVDRVRIEELRRREHTGLPLTETQRTELNAFYRRAEEAEATYLTPATEQIRYQRQSAEKRLRQLETLRERKRAFVIQLEAIVREIESLQAEEEHLLAAQS